jgi:steroid delta-isomerase-like uncharacterized protein
MLTEELKAIIRRDVEEVWNARNPAKIDEHFATNYINHEPNAPNVRDLAAFKQYASALFTAFPDLHVTIEDMVAEGDKVAKRYSICGTHTGEWLSLPPTGKVATITGITIYRIAGDKIAECWWSYDALGMMQQLGVIPAPGQPEK